MEKQVISNYELEAMIRAFTGTRIGTGYAIRIGEVVEKLRPAGSDAEIIPISFSEAAALASIVIAQIENTPKV